MELGPYIFYAVIGGLLAGSGVLACGAFAGITAKGGGARIGRTLLAVAFAAAGAAVLMGDRPEGSYRLSWWVIALGVTVPALAAVELVWDVRINAHERAASAAKEAAWQAHLARNHAAGGLPLTPDDGPMSIVSVESGWDDAFGLRRIQRKMLGAVGIGIVASTLAASYLLGGLGSGPDRHSMLLPETLSGRLRSTDPEQMELAADAEADIRNSRRSLATVAVGYYGSNHDEDLVYVEAVSFYSAPRRRLNLRTLLKMEMSSWKEAGNAYGAGIPISVDAGKLGGEAACAGLIVDDLPLTICVWAGAVTEGWIIWYYEKLEDVKSQFAALREQVEAP